MIVRFINFLSGWRPLFTKYIQCIAAEAKPYIQFILNSFYYNQDFRASEAKASLFWLKFDKRQKLPHMKKLDLDNMEALKLQVTQLREDCEVRNDGAVSKAMALSTCLKLIFSLRRTHATQGP